jgi:hypothetical protein
MTQAGCHPRPASQPNASRAASFPGTANLIAAFSGNFCEGWNPGNDVCVSYSGTGNDKVPASK